MRDHDPSATAKAVAAQRAGFDRLSTPYGDPEADDRLQLDVAEGAVFTSGTMSAYLRSRTAFFDRFIVDAIDGGIRQFVMVGAGFDGRSWRYAKAGVRWFELDHPDTQADKRQRLDRLGLSTSGVTFVALDFSRDELPPAMVEAGFDPHQPAAFLCEGVASYLEEAAVDQLLADLATLSAPTSQLALTLLVRGTDGASESSERLRQAVATLGEPLLSVFERGDVRPLLERAGWVVTSAQDLEGTAIERSARGSALVLAHR